MHKTAMLVILGTQQKFQMPHWGHWLRGPSCRAWQGDENSCNVCMYICHMYRFNVNLNSWWTEYWEPLHTINLSQHRCNPPSLIYLLSFKILDGLQTVRIVSFLSQWLYRWYYTSHRFQTGYNGRIACIHCDISAFLPSVSSLQRVKATCMEYESTEYLVSKAIC